jgi:hypothetical protein
MLRLAEEQADLDHQLAAAEAEITRLGEDEQRCHAAVERALRQVRDTLPESTSTISMLHLTHGCSS